MKKIKYYYIRYDLGEGIPTYDFVVVAQNLKEARAEASKILKGDYPEQWDFNGSYENKNFYCKETTADALLKQMILN